VKESNSFRFVKPLLHIHIDDVYAYALLNFLCHAANNDTGESHYSYSSIAYVTGLRDRAIRSATKALVNMGLIRCSVRGTVANKKTKLYAVNHDELAKLEKESKAGRTEFIQSDKERKAKWQRNWRDNANVERVAHTTGAVDLECVANTTRSDVECVRDTHVECVGNSHVEGVGDPRTTKLELRKNQLLNKMQLEAGAAEGSGSLDLESREGRGLTSDDIRVLEEKVSTLKALKEKAIDGKRLADYQTYSRQLQEAQTRLSIANGQLYKAATANAA
jgi:hypothetical protein